MEQLPNWLQDRYKTLQQSFGDRVDRTFSWDEALTTLKDPEGTVLRVLSDLEHFGYLYKETDLIDRRVRAYRLVGVERAISLTQKLEDWRQTTRRKAPPLPEAIDLVWAQCRTALGKKMDLSQAPAQPARLTLQCVTGDAKLTHMRIEKATDLSHLDRTTQSHASEILKLFDASSNAYRSVTNVLLEYEKLRRDFGNRVYDLSVADYAAIDGMPIKPPEQTRNKALCPICRRFPQSQTALALITGNPKMDSIYQTYRGSQAKRASIEVCTYCFIAGWVDLPTALITKDGQSVGKAREYLFITTPLPRDDVQRLLDAIAGRASDQIAEEDEPEDGAITDLALVDQEEAAEYASSITVLSQFLKEKYGIEGYDSLSILGLSKKRLQELRGFVLPSANSMQRVVAVRVPVERLVGEDRVSGAVRRELVKATMYDFWQITGGSLHYNRIAHNAPFSVDGQPITLEEMHRANLAYQIANRYARVGKYQQLNSGIFMLLLSRPREAVNSILRAKHRVKRYAPGKEKIKEVIELAENIAQHDWKFDLGLRIVGTLGEVGLLLKAEGFRKGTGPEDVFTGVELVKWLQRLKMIHDETSARAWANMLLNALKRGDLAYKEYILSKGGQISAPGKETVKKIMDLVDGEDGIIQTCARNGGKLAELSRDLANMDYYLLFYHNQRQAAQKEETK